MRKIMSKKGQISLGDAPQVVMIVGFIFLIMATIAYVSEQYGEALTEDGTAANITDQLEENYMTILQLLELY